MSQYVYSVYVDCRLLYIKSSCGDRCLQQVDRYMERQINEEG